MVSQTPRSSPSRTALPSEKKFCAVVELTLAAGMGRFHACDRLSAAQKSPWLQARWLVHAATSLANKRDVLSCRHRQCTDDSRLSPYRGRW
jgi:hypothetical protein